MALDRLADDGCPNDGPCPDCGGWAGEFREFVHTGHHQRCPAGPGKEEYRRSMDESADILLGYDHVEPEDF